MNKEELRRDITRHKEEHEKSILKCAFCDKKGRYHEYICTGKIERELKSGIIIETEQTICLPNLCWKHKQYWKRIGEEQAKKMVRQKMKSLIRKQDPEDNKGWIEKINSLK